MLRKILILFCFVLLPCISHGQEKGLAIFASGAVRDTLSASAALDTVTGATLFYNARRLDGNFTLAVDVTENTGTITTITVQYRRSYYQLTNASANVVSDWDELGTITADNAYAEEFDLSADANWLYNTGVQFRFLAASGTFNISLDGKLWIR